jgi:putative peptidoglycan lipid II flippase
MLAAAAAFGLAAYGVWWALDDALGRSLGGQLVSVGGGLAVGSLLYAGILLRARLPEAHQVANLLVGRFRRAS